MSENSTETEPVETPTERRPMQSKTTRAYLGLGTMMTLMIGVVLVATGHHSKPQAAEPDAGTPTQQVVTPESREHFNQEVAKAVARQKELNLTHQAPKLTEATAKPSMVDSALNGDTNKDAEAEHKARLAFKLAEIKRGLEATHSSWGGQDQSHPSWSHDHSDVFDCQWKNDARPTGGCGETDF